MKRVFISVPMTGRKEEDIQADIELAMNEYCRTHPEETIQFVWNYDNTDICCGYSHPELYYLGKAIQKMGTCDEVIYGGSVGPSRGCQVEMLVDLLYFPKS